ALSVPMLLRERGLTLWRYQLNGARLCDQNLSCWVGPVVPKFACGWSHTWWIRIDPQIYRFPAACVWVLLCLFGLFATKMNTSYALTYKLFLYCSEKSCLQIFSVQMHWFG